MAEMKQDHLNGAYYGPSIPPRHYNKTSRGRSCCCGPCCILGTIIKLIITIVVVLGIAALIAWLVLRPSKIKFHVENASLTRFDLNNGTNLHYNLSLDISVRNPNKKIGIYYDKLEVTGLYDGERFGFDALPSFYQGHKNTTVLQPVLQGQSLLLGASEVDEFNKEKAVGLFEIDVKINARIRLKVGSLKTRRFSPKIKCELKLPLASASSSAVGFTRTKCDVDF